MRARVVAFGFALSVGVGCALALGSWLRHKHDEAQVARPAPARASALPVASSVGRADFEIAEVVYDGKLATGWEDWGWGPHEIPDGGVAKIQFGGYGGLVLRHDEEMSPHFGGITFKFHAPAEYRDFLDVRLQY